MFRKSCILKPRIRGSFRDLTFPMKCRTRYEFAIRLWKSPEKMSSNLKAGTHAGRSSSTPSLVPKAPRPSVFLLPSLDPSPRVREDPLGTPPSLYLSLSARKVSESLEVVPRI